MWKRAVVLVLVGSLSVAVVPAEGWAKNCKKGKPCGNSCISWDKECHIGATYTPTPLGGGVDIEPEGKAEATEEADVRPEAAEVPPAVWIVGGALVLGVVVFLVADSQSSSGGVLWSW